MTKYATIALYALGALLALVSAAWVYHWFFGQAEEWQQRVREQEAMILTLQQRNEEQGKVMRQMSDQLNTLAEQLKSVDKTASDGIYLIKKMKQEVERRNEEISHMSDTELDALIRRGIARYRAERGQGGTRPDD